MSAEKIARLFKALNDPTRLRILNLLLERECCVCEVTEVLGISQTRTSRNLSQLYNVGLLSLRKAGLWSLYSADKNIKEPFISSILVCLEAVFAQDEAAIKDRQKLHRITREITADCCVAIESDS